MISVIVPVYNGAHVLPDTIPAMMRQRADAEWVFVDDGSDDGSAGVLDELLQAHTPQGGGDARVIRLATNAGRAEARQAGVAASSGDRLFFLDCDVAPEPGYLEAMLRALNRPGVTAAVGRVRLAKRSKQDPYHQYLDSPARGPAGTGGGAAVPWHFFILCVAGVRRDAFEQVGGLAGAVGYGEDLELGARLGRRFPKGLTYVPEAEGKIYDVGTLSTHLEKMEAFGRHSALELAERYPELAIPLRLPIIGPEAPPLQQSVMRLAFSAPVAAVVKGVMPLLPAALQPLPVRYLLAAALARGIRKAYAR